jgi:hypothetical protein
MMGINKTRETKTYTTRVNNFINLRSTNRPSQCPIVEKLLTRSFDIFPTTKGGDQNFLTKGGRQSSTEGRFKMEERFKQSI